MKARAVLFVLFIFQIIFGRSWAQYAPPAGQAGSTAIHKDSSVFVAWATGAAIVRGYQNISDTSSGYASVGSEASAFGIADGMVISLGDAGYTVLSFDNYISNGPGPDFAVFENSFSDDFLELAFVEVSSDGVNFFRFDAVSLTQDTVQVESFGLLDATRLNNLAGKYRAQYGVPFDLEELKTTPGLDVEKITHIKIIDVVGNIDGNYARYDSFGNKINDPWPTSYASSGFDLDAVGVIQCGGCAPAVAGELSALPDVSVYPNPIKTGTSLTISLGQDNLGEAAIISMNGTEVMKKPLSAGINIIPLTELPPAVYFLSIKTAVGYQVRKLIVTPE